MPGWYFVTDYKYAAVVVASLFLDVGSAVASIFGTIAMFSVVFGSCCHLILGVAQ